MKKYISLAIIITFLLNTMWTSGYATIYDESGKLKLTNIEDQISAKEKRSMTPREAMQGVKEKADESTLKDKKGDLKKSTQQQGVENNKLIETPNRGQDNQQDKRALGTEQNGQQVQRGGQLEQGKIETGSIESWLNAYSQAGEGKQAEMASAAGVTPDEVSKMSKETEQKILSFLGTGNNRIPESGITVEGLGDDHSNIDSFINKVRTATTQFMVNVLKRLMPGNSEKGVKDLVSMEDVQSEAAQLGVKLYASESSMNGLEKSLNAGPAVVHLNVGEGVFIVVTAVQNGYVSYIGSDGKAGEPMQVADFMSKWSGKLLSMNQIAPELDGSAKRKTKGVFLQLAKVIQELFSSGSTTNIGDVVTNGAGDSAEALSSAIESLENIFSFGGLLFDTKEVTTKAVLTDIIAGNLNAQVDGDRRPGQLTLGTIRAIAAEYGVSLSEHKTDIKGLREATSGTGIAVVRINKGNNTDGYVVVTAVEDGMVTYFDNGKKVQKLEQEFANSWAGELLSTREPQDQAQLAQHVEGSAITAPVATLKTTQVENDLSRTSVNTAKTDQVATAVSDNTNAVHTASITDAANTAVSTVNQWLTDYVHATDDVERAKMVADMAKTLGVSENQLAALSVESALAIIGYLEKQGSNVINCAIDALANIVGSEINKGEAAEKALFVDILTGTLQSQISGDNAGKQVQISMLAIQTTAKRYGVDLTGYSTDLSGLEAATNGGKSVIAYLDLGNGVGHYVTVTDASAQSVKYIDSNGVSYTVKGDDLSDFQTKWKNGGSKILSQDAVSGSVLTAGDLRTTVGAASTTGTGNGSVDSSLAACGDAYNAAKAAGDTAGMEKAHAAAESIRASLGYSGGADGSQHIAISSSGQSVSDAAVSAAGVAYNVGQSVGSSSVMTSAHLAAESVRSNVTTVNSMVSPIASYSAVKTNNVNAKIPAMSDTDQQAIANYGTAYNAAKKAGDLAGMAQAHAGAEAIRAQYNFLGGADGSGYTQIMANANQGMLSQISNGIKNGLLNPNELVQKINQSSAIGSALDMANPFSGNSMVLGPNTKLRDVAATLGLKLTYDSKTDKIQIGDQSFDVGKIKGTTYNAAEGTHYVTDINAFLDAVNIGSSVAVDTAKNMITLVNPISDLISRAIGEPYDQSLRAEVTKVGGTVTWNGIGQDITVTMGDKTYHIAAKDYEIIDGRACVTSDMLCGILGRTELLGQTFRDGDFDVAWNGSGKPITVTDKKSGEKYEIQNFTIGSDDQAHISKDDINKIFSTTGRSYAHEGNTTVVASADHAVIRTPDSVTEQNYGSLSADQLGEYTSIAGKQGSQFGQWYLIQQKAFRSETVKSPKSGEVLKTSEVLKYFDELVNGETNAVIQQSFHQEYYDELLGMTMEKGSSVVSVGTYKNNRPEGTQLIHEVTSGSGETQVRINDTESFTLKGSLGGLIRASGWTFDEKGLPTVKSVDFKNGKPVAVETAAFTQGGLDGLTLEYAERLMFGDAYISGQQTREQSQQDQSVTQGSQEQQASAQKEEGILSQYHQVLADAAKVQLKDYSYGEFNLLSSEYIDVSKAVGIVYSPADPSKNSVYAEDAAQNIRITATAVDFGKDWRNDWKIQTGSQSKGIVERTVQEKDGDITKTTVLTTSDVTFNDASNVLNARYDFSKREQNSATVIETGKNGTKKTIYQDVAVDLAKNTFVSDQSSNEFVRNYNGEGKLISIRDTYGVNKAVPMVLVPSENPADLSKANTFSVDQRISVEWKIEGDQFKVTGFPAPETFNGMVKGSFVDADGVRHEGMIRDFRLQEYNGTVGAWGVLSKGQGYLAFGESAGGKGPEGDPNFKPSADIIPGTDERGVLFNVDPSKGQNGIQLIHGSLAPWKVGAEYDMLQGSSIKQGRVTYYGGEDAHLSIVDDGNGNPTWQFKNTSISDTYNLSRGDVIYEVNGGKQRVISDAAHSFTLTGKTDDQGRIQYSSGYDFGTVTLESFLDNGKYTGKAVDASFRTDENGYLTFVSTLKNGKFVNYNNKGDGSGGTTKLLGDKEHMPEGTILYKDEEVTVFEVDGAKDNGIQITGYVGQSLSAEWIKPGAVYTLAPGAAIESLDKKTAQVGKADGSSRLIIDSRGQIKYENAELTQINNDYENNCLVVAAQKYLGYDTATIVRRLKNAGIQLDDNKAVSLGEAVAALNQYERNKLEVSASQTGDGYIIGKQTTNSGIMVLKGDQTYHANYISDVSAARGAQVADLNAVNNVQAAGAWDWIQSKYDQYVAPIVERGKELYEEYVPEPVKEIVRENITEPLKEFAEETVAYARERQQYNEDTPTSKKIYDAIDYLGDTMNLLVPEPLQQVQDFIFQSGSYSNSVGGVNVDVSGISLLGGLVNYTRDNNTNQSTVSWFSSDYRELLNESAGQQTVRAGDTVVMRSYQNGDEKTTLVTKGTDANGNPVENVGQREILYGAVLAPTGTHIRNADRPQTVLAEMSGTFSAVDPSANSVLAYDAEGKPVLNSDGSQVQFSGNLRGAMKGYYTDAQGNKVVVDNSGLYDVVDYNIVQPKSYSVYGSQMTYSPDGQLLEQKHGNMTGFGMSYNDTGDAVVGYVSEKVYYDKTSQTVMVRGVQLPLQGKEVTTSGMLTSREIKKDNVLLVNTDHNGDGEASLTWDGKEQGVEQQTEIVTMKDFKRFISDANTVYANESAEQYTYTKTSKAVKYADKDAGEITTEFSMKGYQEKVSGIGSDEILGSRATVTDADGNLLMDRGTSDGKIFKIGSVVVEGDDGEKYTVVNPVISDSHNLYWNDYIAYKDASGKDTGETGKVSYSETADRLNHTIRKVNGQEHTANGMTYKSSDEQMYAGYDNGKGRETEYGGMTQGDLILHQDTLTRLSNASESGNTSSATIDQWTVTHYNRDNPTENGTAEHIRGTSVTTTDAWGRTIDQKLSGSKEAYVLEQGTLDRIGKLATPESMWDANPVSSSELQSRQNVNTHKYGYEYDELGRTVAYEFDNNGVTGSWKGEYEYKGTFVNGTLQENQVQTVLKETTTTSDGRVTTSESPYSYSFNFAPIDLTDMIAVNKDNGNVGSLGNMLDIMSTASRKLDVALQETHNSYQISHEAVRARLDQIAKEQLGGNVKIQEDEKGMYVDTGDAIVRFNESGDIASINKKELGWLGTIKYGYYAVKDSVVAGYDYVTGNSENDGMSLGERIRHHATSVDEIEYVYNVQKDYRVKFVVNAPASAGSSDADEVIGLYSSLDISGQGLVFGGLNRTKGVYSYETSYKGKIAYVNQLENEISDLKAHGGNAAEVAEKERMLRVLCAYNYSKDFSTRSGISGLADGACNIYDYFAGDPDKAEWKTCLSKYAVQDDTENIALDSAKTIASVTFFPFMAVQPGYDQWTYASAKAEKDTEIAAAEKAGDTARVEELKTQKLMLEASMHGSDAGESVLNLFFKAPFAIKSAMGGYDDEFQSYVQDIKSNQEKYHLIDTDLQDVSSVNIVAGRASYSSTDALFDVLLVGTLVADVVTLGGATAATAATRMVDVGLELGSAGTKIERGVGLVSKLTDIGTKVAESRVWNVAKSAATKVADMPVIKQTLRVGEYADDLASKIPGLSQMNHTRHMITGAGVFVAADEAVSLVNNGRLLTFKEAVQSAKKGAVLGAETSIAASILGKVAGSVAMTEWGGRIAVSAEEGGKLASYTNKVITQLSAYGRDAANIPISFGSVFNFTKAAPLFSLFNTAWDSLWAGEFTYKGKEQGSSFLQYLVTDAADFAKMGIYLPTMLGAIQFNQGIFGGGVRSTALTEHTVTNWTKVLLNINNREALEKIAAENLKRATSTTGKGLLHTIDSTAFMSSFLSVSNQAIYQLGKAGGLNDKDAEALAGTLAFYALVLLPAYTPRARAAMRSFESSEGLQKFMTNIESEGLGDKLVRDVYGSEMTNRLPPEYRQLTVRDFRNMVNAEILRDIDLSKLSGKDGETKISDVLQEGGRPELVGELQIRDLNQSMLSYNVMMDMGVDKLIEIASDSMSDATKNEISFIQDSKVAAESARHQLASRLSDQQVIDVAITGTDAVIDGKIIDNALISDICAARLALMTIEGGREIKNMIASAAKEAGKKLDNVETTFKSQIDQINIIAAKEGALEDKIAEIRTEIFEADGQTRVSTAEKLAILAKSNLIKDSNLKVELEKIANDILNKNNLVRATQKLLNLNHEEINGIKESILKSIVGKDTFVNVLLSICDTTMSSKDLANKIMTNLANEIGTYTPGFTDFNNPQKEVFRSIAEELKIGNESANGLVRSLHRLRTGGGKSYIALLTLFSMLPKASLENKFITYFTNNAVNAGQFEQNYVEHFKGIVGEVVVLDREIGSPDLKTKLTNATLVVTSYDAWARLIAGEYSKLLTDPKNGEQNQKILTAHDIKFEIDNDGRVSFVNPTDACKAKDVLMAEERITDDILLPFKRIGDSIQDEMDFFATIPLQALALSMGRFSTESPMIEYYKELQASDMNENQIDALTEKYYEHGISKDKIKADIRLGKEYAQRMQELHGMIDTVVTEAIEKDLKVTADTLMPGIMAQFKDIGIGESEIKTFVEERLSDQKSIKYFEKIAEVTNDLHLKTVSYKGDFKTTGPRSKVSKEGTVNKIWHDLLDSLSEFNGRHLSELKEKIAEEKKNAYSEEGFDLEKGIEAKIAEIQNEFGDLYEDSKISEHIRNGMGAYELKELEDYYIENGRVVVINQGFGVKDLTLPSGMMQVLECIHKANGDKIDGITKPMRETYISNSVSAMSLFESSIGLSGTASKVVKASVLDPLNIEVSGTSADMKVGENHLLTATLKESGDIILTAAREMDSQGMASFHFVLTPNSNISMKIYLQTIDSMIGRALEGFNVSRAEILKEISNNTEVVRDANGMKKILKKVGVDEAEIDGVLAKLMSSEIGSVKYVGPDITSEGLENIEREVKDGKYKYLISDAYPLGRGWDVGNMRSGFSKLGGTQYLKNVLRESGKTAEEIDGIIKGISADVSEIIKSHESASDALKKNGGSELGLETNLEELAAKTREAIAETVTRSLQDTGVGEAIVQKLKDQLSNKVQVTMYVVEPELMTETQIKQGVGRIDPYGSNRFDEGFFAKDIVSMVSIESAREIDSLRETILKKYDGEYSLDAILGELERLYMENEIGALEKAGQKILAVRSDAWAKEQNSAERPDAQNAKEKLSSQGWTAEQINKIINATGDGKKISTEEWFQIENMTRFHDLLQGMVPNENTVKGMLAQLTMAAEKDAGSNINTDQLGTILSGEADGFMHVLLNVAGSNTEAVKSGLYKTLSNVMTTARELGESKRKIASIVTNMTQKEKEKLAELSSRVSNEDTSRLNKMGAQLSLIAKYPSLSWTNNKAMRLQETLDQYSAGYTGDSVEKYLPMVIAAGVKVEEDGTVAFDESKLSALRKTVTGTVNNLLKISRENAGLSGLSNVGNISFGEFVSLAGQDNSVQLLDKLAEGKTDTREMAAVRTIVDSVKKQIDVETAAYLQMLGENVKDLSTVERLARAAIMQKVSTASQIAAFAAETGLDVKLVAQLMNLSMSEADIDTALKKYDEIKANMVSLAKTGITQNDVDSLTIQQLAGSADYKSLFQARQNKKDVTVRAKEVMQSLGVDITQVGQNGKANDACRAIQTVLEKLGDNDNEVQAYNNTLQLSVNIKMDSLKKGYRMSSDQYERIIETSEGFIAGRDSILQAVSDGTISNGINAWVNAFTGTKKLSQRLGMAGYLMPMSLLAEYATRSNLTSQDISTVSSDLNGLVNCAVVALNEVTGVEDATQAVTGYLIDILQGQTDNISGEQPQMSMSAIQAVLERSGWNFSGLDIGQIGNLQTFFEQALGNGKNGIIAHLKGEKGNVDHFIVIKGLDSEGNLMYVDNKTDNGKNKTMDLASFKLRSSGIALVENATVAALDLKTIDVESNQLRLAAGGELRDLKGAGDVMPVMVPGYADPAQSAEVKGKIEGMITKYAEAVTQPADEVMNAALRGLVYGYGTEDKLKVAIGMKADQQVSPAAIRDSYLAQYDGLKASLESGKITEKGFELRTAMLQSAAVILSDPELKAAFNNIQNGADSDVIGDLKKGISEKFTGVNDRVVEGLAAKIYITVGIADTSVPEAVVTETIINEIRKEIEIKRSPIQQFVRALKRLTSSSSLDGELKDMFGVDSFSMSGPIEKRLNLNISPLGAKAVAGSA